MPARGAMIAVLCALASAAAFFLAHGTADVWLLAWVAPIPILWLAFGAQRTWQVALAAFAAYAVGEVGLLWPYSPHGTFGSWAYSQMDVPVMIQGASLLGLWIISFLIGLLSACVAMSLRRRTALPFAIAAAFVIGNIAFGVWRMRQPEGPTIRVAAVAIDHDDRMSPDAVVVQQVSEVRRLAAQGAELLVFPEKSALLPADQRQATLAPLVAVAQETRVTVVTGFDQTGRERRNVAYAVGRDGAMITYTKRHHIPGLEQGYVVGSGAGLLSQGSAVAICKYFDFQGTMRNDVLAAASQEGLTLMSAPAWDFNADGWLHARMAVMRGVEGGYAVVRAAANGLLTISDAQGRVRARSTSGVDRLSR